MEGQRGLDSVWMMRMLVAIRHTLAMGFWFSLDIADELTAMVAASNNMPISPNSKQGQQLAHIERYFKRTLVMSDHYVSKPMAMLLNQVRSELHWQQNPNYLANPDTQEFVNRYGYVELIGPNGHVKCEDFATGFIFMQPNTTYPAHHHPATEVYYVVSGQVRFKIDDRPWKQSPAGAYQIHEPWQQHTMQTQKQHMLALYCWRGDVTVRADLSAETPPSA